MTTDKKPLSMAIARHFTSDRIPPPGRAVVDYITAGNGIYKRAVSDLFYASIPIVETRPCHVVGLRNLAPYILMRYGKIPAAILIRAIGWSRMSMPNEAMFHVRHDGTGFHLSPPTQSANVGGVSYTMPAERFSPGQWPIVMDIHSHHSMRACFSATDDWDELGFRLYCTLGRLQNDVPQVAIRLGVYGDWFPMRVVDVFEFYSDVSEQLASAAVAAFVEDVHEH